MNQWTRTGIFGGVALLGVVLAWASLPRPTGQGVPSEVGKPMFPKLSDPEAVQSLEILYVDPDVASRGTGSSTPSDVSRFKVARIDNRWVIPSHQNYPADAEDQMRDAATALIGVEAIQVASDLPSEHAMYGVVEPNPEKTAATDEGVGKLIIMKDGKGKDLARVVVGKEVANTEDQRFVRRPDQDRVYTAKVDEEAFSTKFEKWIEKDLLELNTADISQVVIRDYTVQTGITLQGELAPANFQQRLDMTLDWDKEDFKWKLGQLIEFPNAKPTPTELLDDEELNTSKLSDMKWALDELEIVDVERKPEGLKPDLGASESFLKNRGERQALALKGFFPAMRDETLDLISSDGEIIVRTVDGVEYVLRFGQVAGMSGEGEEGKLNRYLFVTARLDEENLQPPELEQVPDLPEEEPAAKENGGGDGDAEPAAGGDTPDGGAEATEAGEDAGENAPAEETGAAPGEAGPEGQPGTAGAADAEQPAEDSADTEPSPASEPADATEDAAGPAAADEGGETSGGAPAEDAADTPGAETPESDTEADADDAAAADAAIDLAAEQARIVKENDRKMDEYQEKKKKALKKVTELNSRFGDWYFVISDDIYQKIHLSRSDIIKLKESAKDEGTGVDAFRELEESGIEGGAEGGEKDGDDS